MKLHITLQKVMKPINDDDDDAESEGEGPEMECNSESRMLEQEVDTVSSYSGFRLGKVLDAKTRLTRYESHHNFTCLSYKTSPSSLKSST